MIRRVTADRRSFKTLEFTSGLNLLRADKSERAGSRDSRNGAGKTSLVELVHFLLGATAPATGIFRSQTLRDWHFEIEMMVEGRLSTARRSGRSHQLMEVSGALGARDFPQQPSLTAGPRRAPMSVDSWKSVLGEHWFGLEASDDGKYRPGFRSLFSYLARRAADGGFQNPVQYWANQQVWDRQVSVSWLLGLDWTVAQRFQMLRERQAGVRGLKRAISSGELSRLSPGAAALRTALTVSRDKARAKKERLDEFRVLADYDELEREADELTARINALSGDDIADRSLIRDLQTSLHNEEDPERSQIERLFEEAGVVLPGLAQQRLDAVDRFHRQVVENRRSHLKAEIESARERLGVRAREKGSLDERRRQIMAILKSGGALAEYTALREEVGRAEAEVQGLSERLRDAERLESLQTELRSERANLKRALLDDIRERDEWVRDVILRFEKLSELLYERAGSLTIGASDGGPKFEVTIPSGRSRGIRNMQIFCFDMMLMDLLAERGLSPGFLIHDSHLFDGVDERQVARALQVGAQRAEACDFQYIVTLNTDAIPAEGFDPGFALEDYFMEVRLTDAREDGGLFGVRFD